MKEASQDCHRLCRIQAELFEKSITALEMSSEVFVRRFMRSEVAKEFDSVAFLDGTKTIDDIFNDLDAQYGPTSYGSKKYHRDVMYWCGYLYREFCYTYEVSSERAYKMLPMKDVASSYEAYHTLDVQAAIARLLEEKGISFNPEDMMRKGVEIMRRVRKEMEAKRASTKQK